MGSTAENRTLMKPQIGLRLSPGPPLPITVLVLLQTLHVSDSLSWWFHLPLQFAIPPPPQTSVLSSKTRHAVTIWTSGHIQDASSSTLPQCSQHLHLLRATESTKVNQDEGKLQARHTSECLNPCIFHSALQQSCNEGPLLALSQRRRNTLPFYP